MCLQSSWFTQTASTGPPRFVQHCWNRSIQARSQDLEKGGGYFDRVRKKSANNLDPNFHCPWISFTRFVWKLRRNFSESSEIQRFFPPKTRWSPKKKKRSSPKLRVIIRPKSEFQRFFPPKTRWSPKEKKKKKKKVFTEFESDFSAEIRISKVFSAQNRVVSKKKRSSPRVFVRWDWFFVQFRKFRRLRRGCFCMGGGYFQFFTKNRPQKHQKHAILHTSQANGGARAPPPPSGYATDSIPDWRWVWWEEQPAKGE